MESLDPVIEAALNHLGAAGFQLRESRTALVLGSGFGDIEAACKTRASVPYAEIPGFAPPAGTAGHVCRLTQGRLWGVPALVLRGRYHVYEGFQPRELVFPVRVAHALGVETLIVTNAAGGIRPDLQAGALMAITDHLNLQGVNPLQGRRRMAGAAPFPPMAGAYDPDLTRELVAAGEQAEVPLKTGVYAALAGPSFETAAEVRMLQLLGADAVGMSTVPEVICAKALGMRVCGLSLITNTAGSTDDSHESTLAAGRSAQARIAEVLEQLFRRLA